jgi:superfamily II DNA or RNA helicase
LIMLGTHLAVREYMELRFDRGTLVLSGLAQSAAAQLPGVIWDPRVRAYRAPGHRYSDLLAALKRTGLAIADRVPFEGALPARWSDVDLRPYQAAALTSWELSGRRGLVVLPTGAGKTRTLCLVPTRVLLTQWRTALEKHYSGPIGQYGDGVRTSEPVTLATFASAFRYMEVLGNRFGLLVVDEAHHFGVGAGDESLELCSASARIGLTGTPPTSEAQQARLERLIGPEVYRQTVSDLTGEFLAPCRIVTLALALSPEERRAYDLETGIYRPVARQFFRYAPRSTWRDFQRAAMRSHHGRRALAAWRRSREVVAFTMAKQETLARLLGEHRGSRVLIFAGDNDTAYAISRKHFVMPITCHIGRTERSQALRRFEDGDLRVLVSAQVLNEGVDVPTADVAVLVAGRLGVREYVQRVGRVLRPAPGKRAIVYEMVTRETHEVREANRKRQQLDP